MKSLLRALVISFLVLAKVEAPAQAKLGTAGDFFVATNGNDGWSGKSSEPNATRSDGPFATVARARDAVRELKRVSSKKEITVRIRGGTHRLTETLVFSLADSAPERGSVEYAAYGDEQPILSSGVPIGNWRKVKEYSSVFSPAAHGKVWVADLPKQLDRILTLYDGNVRLPRARGEGFAPVDFVNHRSAQDRITFPDKAMRNWPDLKNAELLVIPSADYEMCILPLAAVNEPMHNATTTVPASRAIGRVKFVPISAWVENVLEYLDHAGEWVVNTTERKIYLWPIKGQPGEHIMAPQLTELLRIEGVIHRDGPRDEPVQGLAFRRLTFSHTERLPWHGDTGWQLQHHWEMFDQPTAAVRLRGAENCLVQGCRFTALSGTGVRLDLHSQKNGVLDNEIDHVGGVGVLLAGYGPGTKDVNRRNVVSNNWIHHTGEIYWAAPAIMIWQSGENRIANNLIHHTPYSGITLSTRNTWNHGNTTHDGARTVRWAEVGDPEKLESWHQREPFMHTRRNVIERNDIHHVMETMGDGDGIYISGTGGGNVIRQNYIHDCDSDGMGNGIRCDDDQHETIIEGNIIFRVRCVGQGICSKGVNHIINNIVADLRPSGRPIRPERVARAYIGLVVNPVTGSRIERNIIVSRQNDRPIYLQNRIYGDGGEPLLRECKADYNLYHCFEDSAWPRQHLETERAFGIERLSQSADPQFADFEKGDFRLKPNSPALALGFQPIDMSLIGLLPRADELKPK